MIRRREVEWRCVCVSLRLYKKVHSVDKELEYLFVCLFTWRAYVTESPTRPPPILSRLITPNNAAKKIKQFPINSKRRDNHLQSKTITDFHLNFTISRLVWQSIVSSFLSPSDLLCVCDPERLYFYLCFVFFLYMRENLIEDTPHHINTRQNKPKQTRKQTQTKTYKQRYKQEHQKRNSTIVFTFYTFYDKL